MPLRLTFLGGYLILLSESSHPGQALESHRYF